LDGSIVYVNPCFETLTGYTRTEVYGKNPRILNSGTQSTEFYKELWQTLTSGGVWQGRFINRRKDGSLYTEEATIAPVRDAKGFIHKYVAVKRDVTRLEELQNELRHAQKMEAVGQLAGGIAHDLNNVLQIITLASHLALTSEDCDYKDARINETVAAATKGAGVISQLLAFSRRQTMRLEAMDLNDVVKETAKLLKHLLREDIQLRLDMDANLGGIKADPVQITQVILNLAVNARDAMPQGGLLEIAARNWNFEAGDGFATAHPHLPAGNYVRVTVRDTGTGIDEPAKAHVFEPFFTTKEIGKGTGLGLSTVYGIVTQSKGHIEFDSVVGEGTTFSLYFPRSEQPAAAGAPSGSRADAVPALARYSVLVVEDEEMVLNSIAAALRKEGFRVSTSASAREALESARLDTPTLVITDVMMAGMKGTELVELLKQQNPSIQTILTSGYCDEEIVQRASQVHGSVFIPKPFSMSKLVETAVRLCHASSQDRTFAANK
jgi:two-component system, cell cycle sensor histidine kinase and response regulator CckA